MKKLLILFAAAMILSSCSVGLYTDTPHVKTTTIVNLSMQPTWGPAGYNYAPYYYFPEFDFYYDVNKAIFYYLNRGRWIAAKHLPPHFPKDLHRYYKVVLTQRNPWLYNSSHRSMYKKYKGVYNQPVIGNKHHPQGPGAPGPQRPPQNNRYDHNKAPQNNGHNGGGSYYGSRNNQSGNDNYDNRNTVRDSRNNNTNRGTAYNNGANAPQRGNSSNSSYNKPTNQSQPNKVAPSNNRGSNNSRSQQTKASNPSSEKKSSSNAQRGSSSSSSQGNRATGSRGR
ncbi:MAG: hypothetical protein IKU88_09595 [Alistipes sp.]|nr:hypothetical protein [Alistipes sp.]